MRAAFCNSSWSTFWDTFLYKKSDSNDYIILLRGPSRNDFAEKECNSYSELVLRVSQWAEWGWEGGTRQWLLLRSGERQQRRRWGGWVRSKILRCGQVQVVSAQVSACVPLEKTASDTASSIWEMIHCWQVAEQRKQRINKGTIPFKETLDDPLRTKCTKMTL